MRDPLTHNLTQGCYWMLGLGDGSDPDENTKSILPNVNKMCVNKIQQRKRKSSSSCGVSLVFYFCTYPGDYSCSSYLYLPLLTYALLTVLTELTIVSTVLLN